jgi:hypothetical protein
MNSNELQLPHELAQPRFSGENFFHKNGKEIKDSKSCCPFPGSVFYQQKKRPSQLAAFSFQ